MFKRKGCFFFPSEACEWPGGRSCATAANSSEQPLPLPSADSSRPYRETERHPGKTNVRTQKGVSPATCYLRCFVLAYFKLLTATQIDWHFISQDLQNKTAIWLINDEHTRNAYLRKSTQDDSVGRYSILHLLVYHCLDYRKKPKRKSSWVTSWLISQARKHTHRCSNKLHVFSNAIYWIQVTSHTVLWGSFYPRLVFIRIRTQTVDIEPEQEERAMRFNSVTPHHLQLHLMDTYHEGMDILMFKETGMVGLRTTSGGITKK